MVSSEEIKQGLHAVFVMEHFRREVSVEELDTISNGLGKSWARDGSSEWFKVQLKNEVAIAAALEGEKW